MEEGKGTHYFHFCTLTLFVKFSNGKRVLCKLVLLPSYLSPLKWILSAAQGQLCGD